jgi:death on curing protein
MTRYLSVDQVLELQAETIREHGGSAGVRDLGLVESAVAQPSMTFGGVELYPTLIDKAAALGFSLVANHAFIDGNKRVGLAAMDVFLRVNGYAVRAPLDEFEATILAVASGTMDRSAFTAWVQQHTQRSEDKVQ